VVLVSRWHLSPSASAAPQLHSCPAPPSHYRPKRWRAESSTFIADPLRVLLDKCRPSPGLTRVIFAHALAGTSRVSLRDLSTEDPFEKIGRLARIDERDLQDSWSVSRPEVSPGALGSKTDGYAGTPTRDDRFSVPIARYRGPGSDPPGRRPVGSPGGCLGRTGRATSRRRGESSVFRGQGRRRLRWTR
jgi:hypothetical protein